MMGNLNLSSNQGHFSLFWYGGEGTPLTLPSKLGETPLEWPHVVGVTKSSLCPGMCEVHMVQKSSTERRVWNSGFESQFCH